MANQELVKELKTIKKELVFIKEHMVDIDSIMTEDDFISLQQYRKEKKDGKLISHNKLKKELGL